MSPQERAFSVYRVSDGTFLPGAYYATEPPDAEALARKGLVAIEGQFDRMTQRVVDGTVVEQKTTPPSPGHEWDAVRRVWVDALEERLQEARAAMEAREKSQLRTMREALLDLLPAKHPARQRLQATDDEIKGLREVASPAVSSTKDGNAEQ
jgi:hypothetical protein